MGYIGYKAAALDPTKTIEASGFQLCLLKTIYDPTKANPSYTPTKTTHTFVIFYMYINIHTYRHIYM